ncbi:hypothetical protein ZWY2020_030067 [Hordeum vulgare]|nr:hypothetical protein ZWY2020_030067 [Hordeum vulgare]
MSTAGLPFTSTAAAFPCNPLSFPLLTPRCTPSSPMPPTSMAATNSFLHLPFSWPDHHRIRSSQNFLFSSKEENSPLKVIDFGLSDFVKPDERLNDIVGSAYYVAPEVLHRSYGTEGDMWIIGVIAYILLCGSRSFWVCTESGIFRVVLKAEPRFDKAPWPTLFAEANDFVKRSPMDPRCTTSEDSFRYDNLQAYESLYQLIFIAEVCFEGPRRSGGMSARSFSSRESARLPSCHSTSGAPRSLHHRQARWPYMATIILVKRVVGPKTPGETCHVVIYHGGNVPYWAGQSYGIIPSQMQYKAFAMTKYICVFFSQNFLFSSKEENSPLKVIDFGLSDFVKPDETLNDIVGSAYYVAPEVLHRSYESGIFRVALKAEPRFDEAPWPTLSAEANDFVKRSPMDPRCTTSEDSFRYDNLQAYESLYQFIFIAEVCFEGSNNLSFSNISWSNTALSWNCGAAAQRRHVCRVD